MSDSGARWRRGGGEAPIDFMARFTSSEQFEKVFREGMGLVEETANYLDGPGRRDARCLDRHGSIAYATESMRLTTRLMQLASWLLLQRAVSSGEITRQAAEAEKHRISLADIGAGSALKSGDRLPAGLIELVSRSLRLHERVMTLDQMIRAANASSAPATNPIANQIDRVAQTFTRSNGRG